MRWGILFFVWTRILRTLFFVRKIYLESIYGYESDFAAISNYRGPEDLENFGYPDWARLFLKIPDVLPWVPFVWEREGGSVLPGRLFMISATFQEIEMIANDPETNKDLKNQIKKKFCMAVEIAIESGAKTILLAANTKRLFNKGELEEMYPSVKFTLGDNFTGLLLGRRIRECFEFIKLRRKKTILLVAPYGMLGSVSLWYLLDLYKKYKGFNIVLMINPKRRDLATKIIGEYSVKFQIVYNYQEIIDRGLKIDMVIACNSSGKFMPTPDQLVGIGASEEKKIFFVDPCEPYSMPSHLYSQVSNLVVRCDSGNGSSQRLHYVLGFLGSYRLLGLTPHEIWGCFCEGMLITAYQKEFDGVDLNTEPTPENITKFRRFYNDSGFTNPPLSCYGRPIVFDETNISSVSTEKVGDVAYSLQTSH